MRQRLVSLRRDEDGTTLVELLVCVLIGTIILMAAFALLDTGTKTQARTSDRFDALQRGRVGMELLNQRLRSAVCGEDTNPDDADKGTAFLVAEPNRVVFRSALGTSTGPMIVRPDLRALELRDGDIVESVFRPTNPKGTPVYGNYPTTPDKTRVLVSGVRLQPGTDGIFAYVAVNPKSGLDEDIPEGPARLGALKVRVTLAFTTRRADVKATPFTSVVMTNTDDPTDTDQVPQCAP